MKECLNCNYARLACHNEYIGCAYCAEQLHKENPVTEDELMYDLQLESLSTGWVYLNKRPNDDIKSNCADSIDLMTNNIPVFRKDFSCRFFEAYKENLNDRDKYNIRIREAISDKYVDCSKRKQDKQKELTEILRKLSENKKTMPYQDYIDLQKYASVLQTEVENLCVELNTWDKVREVCMDVIDER